jgi:hypothetical protein
MPVAEPFKMCRWRIVFSSPRSVLYRNESKNSVMLLNGTFALNGQAGRGQLSGNARRENSAAMSMLPKSLVGLSIVQAGTTPPQPCDHGEPEQRGGV